MDSCFVFKWNYLISAVQSRQSSYEESYDTLILSGEGHLAKLFRFYEDHFYMQSNGEFLVNIRIVISLA